MNQSYIFFSSESALLLVSTILIVVSPIAKILKIDRNTMAISCQNYAYHCHQKSNMYGQFMLGISEEVVRILLFTGS